MVTPADPGRMSQAACTSSTGGRLRRPSLMPLEALRREGHRRARRAILSRTTWARKLRPPGPRILIAVPLAACTYLRMACGRHGGS